MVLAYPRENSPLRQKIASDYFLAALNDPHFKTRIREHESPDLQRAYNTALHLKIQYEVAHAMESDEAKNPSTERQDMPRLEKHPNHHSNKFEEQVIFLTSKWKPWRRQSHRWRSQPAASIQRHRRRFMRCRQKPNNFAMS